MSKAKQEQKISFTTSTLYIALRIKEAKNAEMLLPPLPSTTVGKARSRHSEGQVNRDTIMKVTLEKDIK